MHFMSYIWQQNFTIENLDLFRLCPPRMLCDPQSQITCHYIGNQYVKKYDACIRGCKYYAPTKLGGGGAQTEKIRNFTTQARVVDRLPSFVLN